MVDHRVVKLKTLHTGDKFRRPAGQFVYEVTEERIDNGCGGLRIWCLNPDGTQQRQTGDYWHSGNEDVVLVESVSTNIPIINFGASEGDTVIVRCADSRRSIDFMVSTSAEITVEVKPNPWQDITDELVPNFIKSHKEFLLQDDHSGGKYIVLEYKNEIAVRFTHSGRQVTDGYRIKDFGSCSYRVYYRGSIKH